MYLSVALSAPWAKAEQGGTQRLAEGAEGCVCTPWERRFLRPFLVPSDSAAVTQTWFSQAQGSASEQKRNASFEASRNTAPSFLLLCFFSQ